MTRSKLWLMAAGTIVFAAMVYSLLSPEPNSQYVETLTNARKEKNRYFRISPGSPLTEAMKIQFTGLEYYPPDPEFRVVAVFYPDAESRVVKFPLSGGKDDSLFMAGHLKFSLEGKEWVLSAFRHGIEDNDTLFIPFTDGTSGIETYGGGRYLEVIRQANNEVEIDFNLAYNPFCAYNEKFSCVIPPSENHLELEIRSGEKYAVH